MITVSGVNYFYNKNKNDISLQAFLTIIQSAHFLAATQHMPIGVKQNGDTVITFIDANGDGGITATTQILASTQISASGNLHWRSFPIYRNYILFDENAADNGSFWYCLNSKPIWQVVVNKTGRAKVANKITMQC